MTTKDKAREAFEEWFLEYQGYKAEGNNILVEDCWQAYQAATQANKEKLRECERLLRFARLDAADRPIYRKQLEQAIETLKQIINQGEVK